MNTSTQPVNPSEIPVQPQPIQTPPVNNQKDFLPIILGVIFLLLVVGSGAYYFGTKQNNNSMNNNLPTTNPQVTLAPTVADQNSLPVNPTSSNKTVVAPSVNPTSDVSQPTQKPSSPDKTVVIPSSWKQFTAIDPDFGVKTIMSMPPGYSFSFTGSEFTIQNDSDATELWDYSSSVYRDNDGLLRNHYDSISRKAWYEKRLSEIQSIDKIVSVEEKPLNSSTYLEITVQTPSYDDHGVTSGTKNGTHFVYVQNNILHMITPSSNKAYTLAAQIPNDIEPILVSLTSVQTK